MASFFDRYPQQTKLINTIETICSLFRVFKFNNWVRYIPPDADISQPKMIGWNSYSRISDTHAVSIPLTYVESSKSMRLACIYCKHPQLYLSQSHYSKIGPPKSPSSLVSYGHKVSTFTCVPLLKTCTSLLRDHPANNLSTRSVHACACCRCMYACIRISEWCV